MTSDDPDTPYKPPSSDAELIARTEEKMDLLAAHLQFLHQDFERLANTNPAYFSTPSSLFFNLRRATDTLLALYEKDKLELAKTIFEIRKAIEEERTPCLSTTAIQTLRPYCAPAELSSSLVSRRWFMTVLGATATTALTAPNLATTLDHSRVTRASLGDAQKYADAFAKQAPSTLSNEDREKLIELVTRTIPRLEQELQGDVTSFAITFLKGLIVAGNASLLTDLFTSNSTAANNAITTLNRVLENSCIEAGINAIHKLPASVSR